MPATPDTDGIVHTSVNVPFVRFQTPTAADIYCAGFITKDRVPDANYVNGGLQTPTSTKFEIGELVYLAGSGYQAGQLFSVVRELRDVNEYEIYPGRKSSGCHRTPLRRDRQGANRRYAQPQRHCPGGIQLRSH
jgi:hypothetical protein